MRFARAGRLADGPASRAGGRTRGEGPGGSWSGLAAPAGLLVAVTLAAGCDRVGNPFEALGGGLPPPDEFQVIQYEPLVVPETYNLPEPTPGAPSPRAPNPQQEAVAALLGPGAVQAAAASPGPGEERLLASADASAASDDIRVQLEQDRQAAAAGGEYEPPTIWELLGFGGGEEEVDETEIIDPDAEAERLQAQGIATPVDPDAAERAAREAAEAAEPEPEPEVIDRRPTNRIGPEAEPAF